MCVCANQSLTGAKEIVSTVDPISTENETYTGSFVSVSFHIECKRACTHIGISPRVCAHIFFGLVMLTHSVQSSNQVPCFSSNPWKSSESEQAREA